MPAGSGAARRFGLNQTSWISLHNWEGEKKRFGGWRGRVAGVPGVMLLSSSPRFILPTNSPAYLFSFLSSLPTVPGTVSLLFITAFHTLSFRLYALLFPQPLKPPLPRPRVSLFLSPCLVTGQFQEPLRCDSHLGTPRASQKLAKRVLVLSSRFGSMRLLGYFAPGHRL